MLFTLWISLCAVGHLVLSNPFTPRCYVCPERSAFPECLHVLDRCRHDEVCEIVYGTLEARIECVKSKDCKHDIQQSHERCGHGGHFVHHQCEICCKDNNCVTQQLAAVNGALMGTTTATATTGMVQSTTTSSSVTITTKAPSSSTISPDKLWFYSPCVDQMANATCVGLQSTMCNDAYGISLCAETCGLCQLLVSNFNRHTICEDELINDECVLFQETRDICHNPLAQFTCAKTCGLCDSVIEGLTKQLLSGEITAPTDATTVTVTPSGPITTTSAPHINTTTPMDSTSTSVLTITTTAPHMDTTVIATTSAPHMDTTVEKCVDKLQPGECATIPDICNSSMGHSLCMQFCNVCTMVEFPTTVVPTPVLDPLLYNVCSDITDANTCSGLTPNNCQTANEMRMCAETCGLCAHLHTTFNRDIICKDELINDECEAFKAEDGFCGQYITQITCPKTCDICDKAAETLINQLLNKTTTGS